MEWEMDLKKVVEELVYQQLTEIKETKPKQEWEKHSDNLREAWNTILEYTPEPGYNVLYDVAMGIIDNYIWEEEEE